MLLDAHIVIWWLRDDRRRLTPPVIAALGDPETDSVVSAAVIWEMAIKRSIGKLRLPVDNVPAALEDLGARLLPIDPAHADHVSTLPHHHRDPFDRLLVAQAQLEQLPIVTVDPAIRQYDVETIG